MVELTINQALKNAIQAHKNGNPAAAKELYLSILEKQQGHADANHNIAILYFSELRIQKAISHFKLAIDTNPTVPMYWISFLSMLTKTSNFDAAFKLFRNAKKFIKDEELLDRIHTELNDNFNLKRSREKFWNNNTPILTTLTNLLESAKYDEMLQFYEKSVPNDFRTDKDLNLQGVALLRKGNTDQAIRKFKQATKIRVSNHDVYNNLGSAFRIVGKLDEAVDCFQKALALNPELKEAHYNIGQICFQQSNFPNAIDYFVAALDIDDTFVGAYSGLAACLKKVRFTHHVTHLDNKILQLLDFHGLVQPKEIAIAVLSLIKCDKVFLSDLSAASLSSNAKTFQTSIKKLSKKTLFWKLISVSTVPDPLLERNLNALVAKFLNFLEDLDVDDEIEYVLSNLILHCHMNEYLFTFDETVSKLLATCRNRSDKITGDITLSDPSILKLMLTGKIYNECWIPKVTVTDRFLSCFNRLVSEPLAEERIKLALPSLGKIDNQVSAKVASQYEESPYPRWVNLQTYKHAITPAEFMKSMNFDTNYSLRVAPKILVAGGGTGQHPIATASRFKDSEVLAIDLSKTSLAYAKRKADELGFRNLSFKQCDILETKLLGTQFEIIESVGVLHHMDDPLEGWRCLVDQLRTGGLIKIGLYSRLARKHVIKIREEIASQNLVLSMQTIKEYRSGILESDEEHHKLIQESSDFYSLSSVRDLLFNIQETQFDLSEIKSILNDLKLKFLGFEDQAIIRDFKTMFPEKGSEVNLDYWHRYELSKPFIFSRMYQFWCQKV